mmetsp:Transcript_67287/g.160496  ORF Transcript_67287/g.160496 Transcript_67287/m.160496 type:complete len:379 (-) Transcript_67287:2266-3402(-)
MRHLCLRDIHCDSQAQHHSCSDAQSQLILVLLDEADDGAGLLGRWHRRGRGPTEASHVVGGFRRGGWPWRIRVPHDLPLLGHDGRLHHGILPVVATEVGATTQDLQQRSEVAAQHFARLRRHLSRVICLANDGDAIWRHHSLVLLCVNTVASSLCCKVYDHRALSHRSHHFSGDELRCRSVGNHGCRDDDVHVRDNPCISGKLGCHEFIAHDSGIATSTLSCDALRIHGHKLSPHTLHLLSGGVAHVVRQDLASQGMRRSDGAESRHASTDDEDLGRGHGPKGGGPGAAEAGEALEGVQHRTVACDVCHGGQGVQLLGSRHPRHERQVDHVAGDVPQRRKQLLCAVHIPKPHQRLRALQHLHLVQQRLADLEDDVGLL